MNPESDSLIRIAVQQVITSDFSTQGPASGFKIIDNNAAGKNDVYPGAFAGAEYVPAIWS